MGTQTADGGGDAAEFNELQFERRLTSLKDSQDSINACCHWCLDNRAHHKRIVNVWLNVVKRVKIEQRLILFYLANDVVQYAKKKCAEFVDSYGTAIQKATTLVRDEKVKHKILRIFKIWQQRAIYDEDFISDLCGLISVVPSGSKGDEPHEFHATYLVTKIKASAKLHKDTVEKLKRVEAHAPKVQLGSEVFTAVKDRAHLDDRAKDLDDHVKYIEEYIEALKIEIKSQIMLVSVLKTANVQLDADRKDVKLVSHAYKMFGMRVKTLEKKLEEHVQSLSSPIPSPDINAPSPSSGSDIDLPEDAAPPAVNSTNTTAYPAQAFYNPARRDDADFPSNGFSSFIGSNIPFNIFSAKQDQPPLPPPKPVEAPAAYFAPTACPPPPIPPFNEEPGPYSGQYYENDDFGNGETPESPPMFERKSFAAAPPPMEYHDPPDAPPVVTGGQDVDHRNLISLTGSPSDSRPWEDGPAEDKDYRIADQDYRLPFDINNLKQAPPPPPPPVQRPADNVECQDMDLSDDEPVHFGGNSRRESLEPPPPLPDLPEEVGGEGGASWHHRGPPPVQTWMEPPPPVHWNSEGPPEGWGGPPPPPFFRGGMRGGPRGGGGNRGRFRGGFRGRRPFRGNFRHNNF